MYKDVFLRDVGVYPVGIHCGRRPVFGSDPTKPYYDYLGLCVHYYSCPVLAEVNDFARWDNDFHCSNRLWCNVIVSNIFFVGNYSDVSYGKYFRRFSIRVLVKGKRGDAFSSQAHITLGKNVGDLNTRVRPSKGNFQK